MRRLLKQKRVMKRSGLTRRDVQAAQTAYADAYHFEPTPADYAKRKLMWMPRKCFAPHEFRQLARLSIRGNYNDFEADPVTRIIMQQAPSACVQLGREYSPAIYVRGPASELRRLQQKQSELRAQEADFLDAETLRLWWD